MFWKRITLFKLLGFAIRVDLSWFFIALLVTWSLAKGLFPEMHEDLGNLTYWTMGIAGAAGLFLSIIFHEFSHALVARRYDIPIEGITLFIFGGVAEMTREPGTPRAEFRMAIAGPIASMMLAAGFLAAHFVSVTYVWPVPAQGVLQYLGWINGILALFNLLPAFPLDGGRVLRAALWQKKRDLGEATRIAARIGARFGLAFMIMGGLFFVSGNIIGGIWWFLIGQFIRSASMTSVQQVMIRKALEGEPVWRFMRPNPISVPPATTIRQFVEDYVYRHHHKLFPVTEGDQLLGQVGIPQIKRIKRADWNRTRVADIAIQCTPDNTIMADADAMEALARMQKKGQSRWLVIARDGRLAGILTLKDMLELFALKLDLESD